MRSHTSAWALGTRSSETHTSGRQRLLQRPYAGRHTFDVGRGLAAVDLIRTFCSSVGASTIRCSPSITTGVIMPYLMFDTTYSQLIETYEQVRTVYIQSWYLICGENKATTVI